MAILDTEKITSIFDNDSAELFTRYHVRIQFRNKLMGGVPKSADVIEAWLRSKAGVTDEWEIREMTLRTLEELGVEVNGSWTLDQMIAASKEVAANRSTNGFKRDHLGLYIEGRQVKAGLKEVTNILFAGERWGATKKGPKGYLAERVFVEEDRIHQGRMEFDGVETMIGHVTGPQGPRSTLTYYEYLFQPSCELTVMSTNDCISADQWKKLLMLLQEVGIGALRSQGHGRFAVQAFDRL